MGGNVLGNRLNNISADFVCLGVNIVLGWLRIKFSCEMHYRL